MPSAQKVRFYLKGIWQIAESPIWHSYRRRRRRRKG